MLPKNGSPFGPGRSSNVRFATIRSGPRESPETSTKMARRAISSILARVGDKWTVLIVVLLGDGPKRFNEISGGYGMKALLIVLLAFASAAAEAGSLEGL